MALHIVNQSAFVEICSKLLQDNDALLLIEAAVYSLVDQQWQPPTKHLYALIDDIEARGLIIPPSIEVIKVDYQQWVALTVFHSSIHCWY